MRRLALLLLALLTGYGQANPLAVSRTRLCAEPDRDFLYASTYDANLSPVWTLGTTSAASWAGSGVEAWYDPASHGGFTLPAGMAPGTYKLDCGRGPEVSIEVVAPPKRKQTHVAANDDSLKNLRKAVNAGFLEIILDAGDHYWSDITALPAGTILRGSGAVVHRVFTTNYGTNWPLLFVGQDASVYGITFVYDQPGQVFIYLAQSPTASQTQTGLVVADCVFKRCNFGFYMSGAYVRDCTFIGGGATIAPGGLWHRCFFIGPTAQDYHAWNYWSRCGSVALLDCSFRDTDRGPILNAAWGPIEDLLCVGLTVTGVNRTPNGNEVWGVEGVGPFRRAQFFHTRVYGCQGSLFQFDQQAEDIYARDVFVDGGQGLFLWGARNVRVRLQDFELRGGAGIYCGANTTDCRFIDGNVVGWLPGRGPQIWQNPSPLSQKRTIACWAEGPNAGTNTLIRVNILGTSFTPSQGFIVERAP